MERFMAWKMFFNKMWTIDRQRVITLFSIQTRAHAYQVKVNKFKEDGTLESKPGSGCQNMKRDQLNG